MIEFKAECGHTVRAKDEDAGGVVRCSYCGRQAAVPDGLDDDLDFLFSDVRQPEDASDVGRRRKRGRGKRLFGFRRHARSRFDLFAVILRMCYAALLIGIVVFVGDRWVVPLFREGGLSGRAVERPPKSALQDGTRRERRREPTTRKGLIARKRTSGLFIASTPLGAMVYCVEGSKAPTGGRIYQTPGCNEARANGEYLRLPDGTYVVEVVLPWNDPSLSDPELPNYLNYRTFRRAIVHASDEQRVQLLDDYFVPDEAGTVFIDETDEQYYIVRQYREVQVRAGRSKGVRALFLPRIAPRGSDRFSIEPLVRDYLPKKEAYGFNKTWVRNELDFYDVPESERTFIIEALCRIGVIPYATLDRGVRLFKIGINDGTFTARIIRDTVE